LPAKDPPAQNKILSSSFSQDVISTELPKKMLAVLPRLTDPHVLQRDVPARRPLLQPAYNSSQHSDAKRKYTETFNLAAKEFVPGAAKDKLPNPPENASLITEPSIHPSINFNVRRVPLNMIHEVYKDIYTQLSEGTTLAARDAALEEARVARTSPNVQAYQVAWKQVYARLKKRAPVLTTEEACTLYDLEQRRAEQKRRARWAAPLTPAELAPLIPSQQELTRWGYIPRHPILQPFNLNELTACHRCTTMFTPQTRKQYPCISHWGKLVGSSPSSSAPRPNS
jgi:hypothetical protein